MPTPNLGLALPVIGSDSDSWGSALNGDLTTIDTWAGRNAYSSNAGFSPTGTASTSRKMMGLGSSWTFTPSATGTKVRVKICGYTSCGSGTVTNSFNAAYGTGTAPVNGAALTGTAVTALDKSQYIPASLAKMDFSVMADVSGLTPATAYWFDMYLAPDSGSIATLVITSVGLEEIKNG